MINKKKIYFKSAVFKKFIIKSLLFILGFVLLLDLILLLAGVLLSDILEGTIVILAPFVIILLGALLIQCAVLNTNHFGVKGWSFVCRYEDISRIIIFKKRRFGTDTRAIMIILNNGYTHEFIVKKADECYEDLKSRCENLVETSVVEYREGELYAKFGDWTFEIISIIRTPLICGFAKMFLIEFADGNLIMLPSKYGVIQDTKMPDFWRHDKVEKSIKNGKNNSDINGHEFWCPEEYLSDYVFFNALAEDRLEDGLKIYKESKKKRMKQVSSIISENDINFISMKEWLGKYSEKA